MIQHEVQYLQIRYLPACFAIRIDRLVVKQIQNFRDPYVDSSACARPFVWLDDLAKSDIEWRVVRHKCKTRRLYDYRDCRLRKKNVED